jgi:hypothetical protein
MALPSSGQLSLLNIGQNQNANSVGVITPYSLRQLSILTGKNFYWDGGFFLNNASISSFYNWSGYGYKNGSPDILHDFGLSTRFASNISNIIDTSGNGRNGTFVTGTGNGTAANITGYTDTFPANIATQTSNQRAIRLDDTAKYGGTQSFTWIIWFRNTSFSTGYNGLISCEGRSGGGTPIGHSLYISNVGGTTINYQRWDGTSGNQQTISLTYGSGGIPSFVSGKWYQATVIYSSGSMQLALYVDGVGYTISTANSTSVSTSASWSCFAGLRYNNWLDGNIGYIATYPNNPGSQAFFDINYYTRGRYDI